LNKRSTCRDIARAANVSPATVSRVARDNPSVDKEIRDRVLLAASQLGVVLGKRKNDSHNLLVFLIANRDLLHSFHFRILVGAEKSCARRGWEIVFQSFRYTPATSTGDLQLPQILTNRRIVRAAVLAGVNYPNLLHVLHERAIPFAVLGNNVVGSWPVEEYDVVYSNDIQGAREATLQLILLGHKHIWFIGDVQLPWFARRAQGYESTMREAGLEPQISQIHSDGRELGYLATRFILAEHKPVTAIIAGHDRVAQGVYEAVRELGMAIPGDISVVGFDADDSSRFYPALASVEQFPEELGRHLVDLTLKRIERPGDSPQQITLPTRVLLNESVRPPLESSSSGKDKNGQPEMSLER